MIKGAATPIAAYVGAKPIMAIAAVIRMIMRKQSGLATFVIGIKSEHMRPVGGVLSQW
jgi:hypothetical protein